MLCSFWDNSSDASPHCKVIVSSLDLRPKCHQESKAHRLYFCRKLITASNTKYLENLMPEVDFYCDSPL